MNMYVLILYRSMISPVIQNMNSNPIHSTEFFSPKHVQISNISAEIPTLWFSSRPIDIWHSRYGPTLTQAIACRPCNTMPSPEPAMIYCKLDTQKKTLWNLNQNTIIFTKIMINIENTVCKISAILFRPQCFNYFSETFGYHWSAHTHRLTTTTPTIAALNTFVHSKSSEWHRG